MDILSTKIALLALAFSFVSLTWNIYKDFVHDRPKLRVRISAGEELPDERGNRRLFLAGKITIGKVEKVVEPKKVLFAITNIGAVDVEVDSVVARYADGKRWELPINERRYLKPYESTNANTPNEELKKRIVNKEVNKFYVRDAKDRQWQFRKKEIGRLAELLSKA